MEAHLTDSDYIYLLYIDIVTYLICMQYCYLHIIILCQYLR